MEPGHSTKQDIEGGENTDEWEIRTKKYINKKIKIWTALYIGKALIFISNIT